MRKRKTGALLLAIAFCLRPGLAQDGYPGILSDLEGLERRLQMPGDPSAAMVQRLSNLEQRLFGAPRSGSMVERLQQLKSAANERTSQPAPASPYANGNPADSSPRPAPAYAVNSGQPSAPARNLEGGRAPENSSGTAANPNAQLSAGPGWVPGAAAPGTPLPALAPSVIPMAPVRGWQPGWQPKKGAETPPAHQEAPALPGSALPGAGAAEASGAAPPSPFNRMVSTPLPLPGAGVLRKNYPPDALPLLNAFPPNLLRMEPDNTALIARPDYYAEVMKATKGKNIRYKNMPIPVYIQPFPDKGFVNCVVRAFESWEMRTDGVVKFSQIDNPNQARIQVVWKRLGADKDAQGCLLGAHTILKYTNHGNGSLSLMSVGAVPVPIYIPRLGPKYTVPPQVMEVNLDLINTKNPAVKYACLQNIVTHELGHALGMLGHSPNQADVMYPVTDEHSRLSQRDINTVIKLYHAKCDIPL